MPRQRSSPSPAPRKRPPTSEMSLRAAVVGWRGSSSVGIEGGYSLQRRTRSYLELIAELPVTWKQRRLVIMFSPDLLSTNTESEAVGALLGSKIEWTAVLPVTPEEFARICQVATASHSMQVRISGTKPRYRHGAIHSWYLEAASSEAHLSSSDDI